jgi:Tfp pilus assembly protein PilW
MEFRTTFSTKRPPGRVHGAFTLLEYLIGIGIGSLVLLTILSLSLYSGKSFAGLANYVDINSSSVNALDQMSKDIRQCVALTGYSTNQVTFNDGTLSPLIYAYNQNARTLTRQSGGQAKILLTQCDDLRFAIYQRTPLPGTYDQYPVAAVTNCKVVAVKWVCSRTILGAKVNSEDIQEAKIVIRKH